MKKSRKIAALILSLIFCITLLAACQPKDSDSDSSPGNASASTVVTDTSAPPPAGAKFADHIIMGTDHTPLSVIDPCHPAGNTPPTLWTYRLVYDTLVFEKDRVLYPMLATAWSTDDYQTYNFTLRDDVYFHNGDKFTARDVEYTINRAKAAIGSMAYGNYIIVDTVNVISDTEIQIVLVAPIVDFLNIVGLSCSCIVNERAISENPETGVWVGTGAYKVTEFDSNNFVTVERNDDYWSDAPYTKSITIRFVPDVAARTIMMQKEEMHISMGGLSPDDIHIFQDNDRYNVVPVFFNNPNTLAFSMTNPITSDYNFRMAVMHALNEEEIAAVAAGDWGVPETTGTMWGHSVIYRNNDIPIVPFDLDLAREYLAKSPYNGEELEIATAADTFVKAAVAVQQQLNRIGINIKINEMDMPGLMGFARFGNESTQMVLTVSGFVGLSSFQNNYLPGGSINRATYVNPRVTELFNIAIGTSDESECEALFRELQEIVAEDPPIVNLFWHRNCIVAVNNIGGMYLPEDVFYDLRYIYMLES